MIQKWADENDYTLDEGCFERYVVDYWSTTNIDDFVTEILVPLQKNSKSSCRIILTLQELLD